ncbi:TetR/AcrR family transcriptional regulator [Propionibacteriaceae bacterium Y2011]|uniref:TetR/AcrR family transcriptional regulator n=1 Tax=Microlunatus sp. Y2014 TaxID=3418488 RepID=UPI003B4CCDB2
MAGTQVPSGRTGRPAVTSRPQILAAARALIDRDGWDTLTIRRLAGELGIGATTLYHHVRDKHELLVLLLNEHLARQARPELPAEPLERIIVVGVALRDALATWPWVAEAVAVDGFIALLDEGALWTVEEIVSTAVAAGCDEAEAVALFRNVWYLATGEVVVRARTLRGRPGGVELGDGFLSHIDPEVMPQLATIGARWPEYAARDTYLDGLRAMVTGMLPGA